MSSDVEHSIISILNNTGDPNKQIREQAERTLFEIMEQSYSDLLKMLSSILCKAALDDQTRLRASTTFKRCFEKYPNRWFTLDKGNREEIKNNLLSGLGTECFTLQMNIGYDIAIIAKYELPAGEWPQIMQILSNGAAKDNNVNFKMTSLIILQNILQELKDKKQIIEANTSIIFTIIFNLMDIDSLKTNYKYFVQVLDTLLQFVPFLGFKFNDGSFRKMFFDFLSICIRDQNKEVIMASARVITESYKTFYMFLPENIDEIMRLIIGLVSSQNDLSCMQGQFLLIDFAEEEIKRKSKSPNLYYGYISKYLKDILDQLKIILVERKTTATSDDYATPYETTTFLLDTLSRLCDTDVIAYVFTFISQYINSDNPRHKAASVYAFYSILETSAKREIAQVLPDGINMMINLMNFPNEDVQINVSICIERIAQFHGLSVIKESYDRAYKALYNAIIAQLNVRPMNNKILIHYLAAVHYFVNSIERDKVQNLDLIFFGQLGQVIQLIFEICYSPGSYNVNFNVCDKGFLALGTIIEHSTTEDFNIINTFVNGIFAALQKTLEPSNFKSKEEQEDFQAYLSTIIIALSNYQGIKITQKMGEDLYNLYSQILTKRGSLFDEALLAISSIIQMIPQGAEGLFDAFTNYLFYGLSQVNEYSICKYALYAVQDLLGCNLANMNNHLPKIMELVQKLINEPTGDRYLKIDILRLFSDIVNNYKNEYAPYYKITLDVAMSALNAFLGMKESDDEFYYESLLSALVEYLECSVRLLGQNGFKEIFSPYLDEVFSFIDKISENLYDFPIETALSCGGIISDLCYVYGGKLADYINDQKVKILCEVLTKSRNEQAKTLGAHLKHVCTSILYASA